MQRSVSTQEGGEKAALTSFLMALESLVFGGGLCAGPADFPAAIEDTAKHYSHYSHYSISASRCHLPGDLLKGDGTGTMQRHEA